jgi:hypothetical protein
LQLLHLTRSSSASVTGADPLAAAAGAAAATGVAPPPDVNAAARPPEAGALDDAANSDIARAIESIEDSRASSA